MTTSPGVVYSFSSNKKGPNAVAIRTGKSPKVIRFDTDETYEVDEVVTVVVTRFRNGEEVKAPEFVSPLAGVLNA